MRLLRGLHGLFPGQFSIQQLNRLPVTERSQRAHRRAIFCDQALRFFYESMLEHVRGAGINPFIQRGTLWLEAKAQNPKSAQWIASLPPKLAHLLPRCEANLNRANQFGRVIGMNFSGAGAVEPQKDLVQIGRTPLTHSRPQSFPQLLGTLRSS